MLFNSLDFVIFLPLVFVLYWSLQRRLKTQNAFLLVASYVFYGWWDWRFLSLILLSTLVDYLAGGRIARARKLGQGKQAKGWLVLSIVVNLGVLGFFKYYNFFVDSFITAFSALGAGASNLAGGGGFTLKIILPVGISFYTFQTLSYTIDIYRGKLAPTRDFLAFATFVAFFPQLVAGPIERAASLLPQMEKKRSFSYEQAGRGIRLMLWGFLKKLVIADSLAPAVNGIFANYQDQHWGILVLGALLFSFQIYGDFSGYSDIARGVARLLGIELMRNFHFPYFSRGIGEFWRKWHISLTSWFKDYVYIPLGGSRVGRIRGIRNVLVIFLVSGLWHGANWTFVVWGAYHALLFVPSFILGRNRRNLDDLQAGRHGMPRAADLLRMAGIFVLVSLGWIFFRAESLGVAVDYLGRILQFQSAAGAFPFLNPYDHQPMTREFITLGLFVLTEFLLVTGRIRLYSPSRWTGLAVDALLLAIIILYIPVNEQLSFIYFQF